MSKKTNCNFEPEAVKVAKSAKVDDKIAEHIKSCDDCRETIRVASLLQTNLTRNLPTRKLPSAGLVWFKFKLREKQRAAESIAKPILIVQLAGTIAAFGTFIWLIFNRSYFPGLDSGLSRVFESMEQVIFPLAAGIIVLTFICTTLIIALRGLLIGK
jgi:hypothetical protein